MWKSLLCPTHGAIMHRVEPNGDTTCLHCLSAKVTKAGQLGRAGEVYGIANGVFLLSEDGGRAVASDIRNALQPAQCVRDEIAGHDGDLPSKWAIDQIEFLDATINRLKALADAFDGK